MNVLKSSLARNCIQRSTRAPIITIKHHQYASSSSRRKGPRFLTKTREQAAAERRARQSWRSHPHNLFTMRQKLLIATVFGVLMFNAREEVMLLLENPAKARRHLSEFL
jgi:hypothetical protein